jgi:hypothetical protein
MASIPTQTSNAAPRRKRDAGETDVLGTLLMVALILALVLITSS